MPSLSTPTRRAGALALALLALAAAACSDPSGPGLSPTARFALVREGDRSLPAVMFQAEGHSATLLADTLDFRADGTGRQITVLRTVDPEHPEGTTNRSATEFSHRRAGESTLIDFVCPPNADCMPGPHLRVVRVEDDLIVTSTRPEFVPMNQRTYAPVASR